MCSLVMIQKVFYTIKRKVVMIIEDIVQALIKHVSL